MRTVIAGRDVIARRNVIARRLAFALLLAAIGLVAIVLVFEWRVSPLPVTPVPAAASSAGDAAQTRRGAYLAIVGNCAGCHTARGAAPYAGGRAIETPFGAVLAPNLTPDVSTGLGAWSADDFRRALHEGRSRDGRYLAPACPYPNFTLVTRADTDALHAYLRSVAPVRSAEHAAEHEQRNNDRVRGLRFPFGLQASLALWRAIAFTPADFTDDPSRPAAWNRGRYLVHGLAHCTACHGERNALGATRDDLAAGGLMPSQRWYAPSLASNHEAGLAAWSQQDAVALLAQGRNAHASVMGPMAQVVAHSTQHLDAADLDAIATYLRALPEAKTSIERSAPRAAASALTRGAAIYDEHCADCHGKQGEGVAGRWPALAGNRAVVLQRPDNVIQAILHGGFAPATAGNPRPHGMPPFAHVLDDEAIAAVVTHVRQSWGHGAGAVSTLDVMRAR